MIAQAIAAQQATSMKDMGKVMNSLRPLIAGAPILHKFPPKSKRNLLNPYFLASCL